MWPCSLLFSQAAPRLCAHRAQLERRGGAGLSGELAHALFDALEGHRHHAVFEDLADHGDGMGVTPQCFSGIGLIHMWLGHCSRARFSQTCPDSAFQCSLAPPGYAIS